MVPPLLNNDLGLDHGTKPVLIQTPIPKLAIEAFNKSVLGWFARLDEMQLHPSALSPALHGLGGEFCTIVHDNGLGAAFQAVEKLRNRLPRNAGSNPLTHTLLGMKLDWKHRRTNVRKILDTTNVRFFNIICCAGCTRTKGDYSNMQEVLQTVLIRCEVPLC